MKTQRTADLFGSRGKTVGKSDEIKVTESARGGPGNSQSQPSGRCEFCGRDTREDVIEAAFWTDTDLAVVENIPARLCDGCGEQFLDEGTAERIQEVLSPSGGEPERRVQVSVYSMPVVRAVGRGRDCPIRDCVWTRNQVEEAVEVDQEDGQALTCKYCGAETIEDLTRSALWVDGEPIVVENIPARVCQHCKEQFYDDETAGKLAAINKDGIVPGLTRREVLVPVFSCADVRGMHCQEPS